MVGLKAPIAVLTAEEPEPYFDFERLDVYRASVPFLVIANEISLGLPRGRGAIAEQLERAATSTTLNVAEGSGEFSRREKARFYRMALRSVTECAAIVEVLRLLGSVNGERHREARSLLLRLAAMPTALAKRHERSK